MMNGINFMNYFDKSKPKSALSSGNLSSATNYFNLAVNSHEEGDLDKAIFLYEKALIFKLDFPEAYNNLGLIFKEKGLIEKAMNLYKKALDYKNDFAQAHFNIGKLLIKQNNINEAILAFRQSIKYNPNDKSSYFNIANCLKITKNFPEAIEIYKKIISFDNNFFEAHFNLAMTFYESSNYKDAIEMFNRPILIRSNDPNCFYYLGNSYAIIDDIDQAIISYIKSLEIDPQKIDAYMNLGLCLTNRKIHSPHPKLRKIMLRFLSEDYFNPNSFSIPTISIINNEKIIQELHKRNEIEYINGNLVNIIFSLLHEELFLKLMNSSIIPDQKLEELLINIRSAILFNINNISKFSELIEFQAALANLCFFNNFIYNESEEESSQIKSLENKINSFFSKNKKPSMHYILCLASFRSLQKYSWANRILVPQELKDLFKNILFDYSEEKKISTKITKFKNVEDVVSCKVQKQYEHNPYPRWKTLGLVTSHSIKEIVSEASIKLYDKNIENILSPKILVAGCGTGQHPLMTAKRFKNSEIVAVDLSLGSLSYAKRKTQEYGQENIKYIQADLLNLSELKQKFDIVESAGVLHHMNVPLDGWKELVKCLKVGGLMKIGLYSKLARQHITEIRKENKKLNIGSDDSTIKLFRNKVFNSDCDYHKKLLISPDFYDLNGLRDLVFHEQEHVFNLLEIENFLIELGLKFSGFDSYDITKFFKSHHSSQEDLYDLTKWHKFEQGNPNLFSRMYQFWVQKII